jgi:hypothetical protein
MKRFHVSSFFLMVFIILLSLFGCSSSLESGEALNGGSQVAAEKIARNFIEQSPIYTSYGKKDTLELVWTKKPIDEEGVEFYYQFESSRLGYTCDRTGFMISSESRYIQVVNIVVRGSEITKATMIGQNPDVTIPERIVWDMIKQEITET